METFMDHRVMYKKYTTSLPPMGCEVVERHLEMAQPTKKHLWREIWCHSPLFSVSLQFNLSKCITITFDIHGQNVKMGSP